MTNEQRMRGTDAGIDWAVLITGYSERALTRLADSDLDTAHLTRRGASNVTSAVYAMDYSLTCTEMTDEGPGDARLQHSNDDR